MPEITLDFSKKNITAYLTEDKKMQRTESLAVIGNPDYYLTIKLQDGVTLYNETRNTHSSGNVNLYGGDIFYLEAPFNIYDTWVSENITNCKYKFMPIIYRTENTEKQDIASGIEVVSDNTTITNLTVNWISTGNIKINKFDEEDNSIKLEGAMFGIYDEDEELVTTIRTDENGEGTSEKIELGKYYIRELDTGSPYYLLNEEIYSIEITENDENVLLQIENKGVDINVSIEKKGNVEIKEGEEVNYTFSNIANLSNTYLEDFKWIDYIPAYFVRLEKMNTGTWNQDLYYDVYYKTNMQNEYVLFKEKLYTLENYELDFTKIELREDENIEEICFDFGTVDIGFREESMPTMVCQSLDNLEDGEVFTNHTKTIGTYFEIIKEANSEWTTIVHKPEPVHEIVLPRTGE